jgi:hypothetical protein
MSQHENEVARSLDSAASHNKKSDNTTPTASVQGYNDPEKGFDSEKAEPQSAEKSLAAGPAPATPVIGPPPDGGAQAWLVVLGAFSGLFVSFGWINCRSNQSLKKQHTNIYQVSEYSRHTTKATN